MIKKKDMTIYESAARERINYLIDNYCDGSQQRFVERTGLNKGSVSQYVNGKNIPSNITASMIAEAFNINPAWLMGFDVPMERVHHNDHDIPDNTTLKAMALYERYAHAIPEVQAAVEALLRSSKSDS